MGPEPEIGQSDEVCQDICVLPLTEYQDTDAEELIVKLQNLKKQEKTRVKKIKLLETEINKIKTELEKPVEAENMDDLNAELVRFRTRLIGVKMSLILS